MYPRTIRLAAPSLLLPTNSHPRRLSVQLRPNTSLSHRPRFLQRHFIRRLWRPGTQRVPPGGERPGNRLQDIRRGHDESIQHELRIDGRHRPSATAAHRTEHSGTFPSLVQILGSRHSVRSSYLMSAGTTMRPVGNYTQATGFLSSGQEPLSCSV